jgi:hypothetical protein
MLAGGAGADDAMPHRARAASATMQRDRASRQKNLF